MKSRMELDLNIALPLDEQQLCQEKLLPVKIPQDFDLNVALNEVEYGDIAPPEPKKEIIIQSSQTRWDYPHQASQILTQVQASNVGSISDRKKGPDFARALSKAAGVYNKATGSSVPEPKLKRLVKIAPKAPAMTVTHVLQQPYAHPFQLQVQQLPSRPSRAVNAEPAGSSNDHRLEILNPIAIGGFRPFGFWHKSSRCC